ncbi:MAG TPA: zinc-dependent alcohol dehydrogenase family protein [Burkholderiaceae bacterium]|nr:zinc-dependent alcohol dehydrogenase family protein [Burkholderiaceae bacterium]
MLAMQLVRPGQPLQLSQRRDPVPGPRQVLIQIACCGVCRTDLHIVDGDLPALDRPIVPGHEIVGRVVAHGDGVEHPAVGARVGVPWLGWTCGACDACTSGRENLCPNAQFTGYHLDGGYADLTVADARYVFPLPDGYTDQQAAPLLCAGLIGYRALRFAGSARRLGIYGFGAAAHIIAQVARHQGRDIFAFTRPGDQAAQQFALELGVTWAGGSDQPAPQALDAALIFAPVGALVPIALKALAPGGTVVCAGIHMSDIPAFPYSWLWQERRILSVANLTRRDGDEFMALAGRIPIETRTENWALADANEALRCLREGRIQGAATLTPTR